MLSASLSDCFRATPTDTFTFFAEISSSVGGAIRPAEMNYNVLNMFCFVVGKKKKKVKRTSSENMEDEPKIHYYHCSAIG